MEQSQEAFVGTALQYLKTIGKWHYSTFKAFMRRNGNHKTSKIPQTSWNEGFTRSAARMIQGQYPNLRTLQETYLGILQREIAASMRAVVQDLRSHEASGGLPMHTFEAAISAHIEGMENTVRDSQKGMIRALRVALDNATSDRPDAFFIEVMQNCYEQCIPDKGPGVKDRTLASIRTYLTMKGERSPFAIVSTKLRNAIMDAANVQADEIKKGLDRIYVRIDAQFESSIIEGKAGPGEAGMRNLLQDFLVKGTERLEGIKADLENLKRAYGH